MREFWLWSICILILLQLSKSVQVKQILNSGQHFFPFSSNPKANLVLNNRHHRSVTLSDSLILPKNYSIYDPPPSVDGKPIEVEFSILVLNVRDVDEIVGELSLEINLRLYWNDSRLSHWANELNSNSMQEFLLLNPALLSKIWHPDVYIDHVKTVSQPYLISRPSSLRIYRDGSLRYSGRLNLVMAYQMDFKYYPADTQKCHIDLRSYAYSTKFVTLDWKEKKGAHLAYHIDLHNFDLALLTTHNFMTRTTSANYSGVRFTVFLRRKLSSHLIQTFIPSILFTIISWLAFLLPVHSTHDRVGIFLTTLLTLVAMFAAVRQSTPNVSYIKALDLWMLACVLTVFLSLIEYVIILKLRSRKQSKIRKSKEEEKIIDDSKCGSDETESNIENQNSSSETIKTTSFITTRNDLQRRMKMILSSETENNIETFTLSLNSASKDAPTSDSDQKTHPSSGYAELAKQIDFYTSRVLPSLFLMFNVVFWPWLMTCSEYYWLPDGPEMYYSL